MPDLGTPRTKTRQDRGVEHLDEGRYNLSVVSLLNIWPKTGTECCDCPRRCMLDVAMCIAQSGHGALDQGGELAPNGLVCAADQHDDGPKCCGALLPAR